MRARSLMAAGAAIAVLFLVTNPCIAQVISTNIAHDARSYGLAGGGVADGSNASTILNNPAVAGRLQGVYLGAFYGELLPEFAVDMNLRGGMLSGGYPVHDGDVALRIGGEIRFARVRWEEPLFYDYGYYGNEESHDQYYSFTAAADLQFARYFHAGMGGTYKSLDLDWAFLGLSGSSAKGDGSAYDIGFLLAYSRTDAARWSFTPALGVSLRNFGSGISLDNSGGTIEPLRHNAYGASIQIQSPHTTVLDSSVPTFAMVFNVDLEKAEALNTAYTAGLELGFWQIVFARLGFQAVQDRKPKELTLGVGAGLPLRSFMFRLDYALVPLDIINSSYNHLDRANKFSLVLGWTPRHSVESN